MGCSVGRIESYMQDVFVLQSGFIVISDRMCS